MITKSYYFPPLCSELKLEVEGMLASSAAGIWKETEVDFINGSDYGLE